jgi:predicted AAA+ superfamily ATPase
MIERDILPEIKDHLDQPEITMLIGSRQSGKTTILNILKSGLLASGHPIIYLNLDIDLDMAKCVSQETLMNYVRLEFGENKGYIFIDEIQRVTNAGLFLKGIYDRQIKHKIIVSGSGSLELKEKIAESLAGRKRLFYISTISIHEFINYKTAYKYKDKLIAFFSLFREMEESILTEYLIWGGYPKVVTSTSFREKQVALSEIFQSYVERDIQLLLKLEKRKEFIQMLQMLASSPGQIVQYLKIGNLVDLKSTTVKNYIWYTTKTFILTEITPFFSNKAKELTHAPMIYFNDHGMQSFLAGNLNYKMTLPELGFKFQQLILQLLTLAIVNTSAKIFYYRNQNQTEVDFIIQYGNRIIPIEAKAIKYDKPKVEKALRSFMDMYACERAFIINRSLQDTIKIKNTSVYFYPWYYLLNKTIDQIISE